MGCELIETGKTPIMDLGLNTYQGFEGGLYPGGVNTRPATYEAEGVALATTVVPLGQDGLPIETGKIVMLSIGISNTKQEFKEFITLTNQLKSQNIVSKKIVQVNGAQGGQTLDIWVDPNSTVWTNVENSLSQKNATPEMVQVVWLKHAHKDAHLLGAFPTHVQTYKSELIQVLQNVKDKYPNVKLVYLSSRTRAYTDDINISPSPEPYCYEEGFAVKWVIEDKINGLLPNLPWLSWGPYLWIDGLIPRSDGKTWECNDVKQDDFTHPSDSGKIKVAEELKEIFLNDITSTPWFLF